MAKTIRFVIFVVLFGAWLVFLRPMALGGDTTYAYVKGASMEPTFHTSDLVVLHQKDSYEVGEVVAFQVGDLRIIHRLVAGNNVDGWTTQGDNNSVTDGVVVSNSDIYGAQSYMIPRGGVLVTASRSPYVWYALVAMFLLAAYRNSVRSRRVSQRKHDVDVIDLRDSSLASPDSESTRV
jgi:signal peptidase